jgi:hypothetical protein
MNVISLNIEESAEDTSIGEILCFDKYSKLSTLDPSITICQHIQTKGGHSITRIRFFDQIMSGIFNNDPGICSK